MFRRGKSETENLALLGMPLSDPQVEDTPGIGPSGAADGLEFSNDDLDPGVYYWVFEGTSSKHQSIIYFEVLAS